MGHLCIAVSSSRADDIQGWLILSGFINCRQYIYPSVGRSCCKPFRCR